MNPLYGIYRQGFACVLQFAIGRDTSGCLKAKTVVEPECMDECECAPPVTVIH